MFWNSCSKTTAISCPPNNLCYHSMLRDLVGEPVIACERKRRQFGARLNFGERQLLSFDSRQRGQIDDRLVRHFVMAKTPSWVKAENGNSGEKLSRVWHVTDEKDGSLMTCSYDIWWMNRAAKEEKAFRFSSWKTSKKAKRAIWWMAENGSLIKGWYEIWWKIETVIWWKTEYSKLVKDF